MLKTKNVVENITQLSNNDKKFNIGEKIYVRNLDQTFIACGGGKFVDSRHVLKCNELAYSCKK